MTGKDLILFVWIKGFIATRHRVCLWHDIKTFYDFGQDVKHFPGIFDCKVINDILSFTMYYLFLARVENNGSAKNSLIFLVLLFSLQGRMAVMIFFKDRPVKK